MLTFAIALAASTALASPQATPALSKPQTAQQQFDAASAAQTAGQCFASIQGFEALEARPSIGKNTRLLATIKLRKALCLAEVGREEEASQNITEALPMLNADNPIERLDMGLGHLALGRIAYREFNYPKAKQQFLTAKSYFAPEDQLEVLTWLTRATMFDAGLESIDYANAALALATSSKSTTTLVLNDLHTLHARALLNHSRNADAFAELKQVLATQGGLTEKVRLADITTRSDLAIAALLIGNTKAAQQYLAYTGAGRYEKSTFSSSIQLELPACDGIGALEPDDFAIIEFSITDDGTVGHAEPIYASRYGPSATAFAAAVNAWAWAAKDIIAIPRLFRNAMRVELRCSTATQRPDITDMLWAELVNWLKEHKVSQLEPSASEAASLDLAMAELKTRTATGGGLALVPPLFSLGGSPLLTPAEQKKWLIEARDILYLARAPAAINAFAEITLANYMASGWQEGLRRRNMLRTILLRPDIAADPRASGAIRLLVAESRYTSRAPFDAMRLILATANDPKLPADDPLRTNALVRLANLQANSGNLDAARLSYAKTGLSAQQCALVDARPSLKHFGGDSSDFPAEALDWGFEGLATIEFNILANGKTNALRAVVAYPPLVFRDAAISILKDSRYEQTYRPDGAAGCGGARQTINFKIPTLHTPKRKTQY